MEEHDATPDMVSLSSSDGASSTTSKRSSDGSIEIVTSCMTGDERACQQLHGTTDLEIENLATNFNNCMADKQRWLSPTRTQR